MDIDRKKTEELVRWNHHYKLLIEFLNKIIENQVETIKELKDKNDDYYNMIQTLKNDNKNILSLLEEIN